MDKFKNVIQEIIDFLNKIDSNAYFSHIGYLNHLVDLIGKNELEEFYKKMDSVEMWGGSGALWESQYGMTDEQQEHFDTLLLKVLNELKNEKRMGKRAKSLYKYFLNK